MPGPLVPNDAIPSIAARIDSPAVLRVLRHLRQAGFLLNSPSLDKETVDVLQKLTALGLVDPGYEGPTDGPPFIWVSNHNGERVLRYFEASPAQGARLESRVTVTPRARTALASLSENDQLAVLAAAEALQGRDPAAWPRDEARRLNPDKPVYLLRVSKGLRAFIRVLDSGGIELFDIVREEALKLFLQRELPGSAGQ
jgi:hypothetical protein